MKISYMLYELEAINSLSVISSALKRNGALLKVMFDSGMVGYADCHAWPEIGDLDIKQQLVLLNQGKLTPVTKCAMEFATLDAKSRAKGKSVFDKQNIPKSHFLVTDIFDCTPKHIEQIVQQGYTCLKLKLGRNLDREVERLQGLFENTFIKLRLDFNETLTSERFRNFLQLIQNLQNQIDFIEDPFPFDVKEWTAIQKEGWTLACDRQAPKAAHRPESAKILIVKPALQSFQEWQQWIHQTRIVTSYLGHPLGQLAAAYVASQVDPTCSHAHGLLSHHAYQPTSFSQYLSWKNPTFILPPGHGFGFDKELEQLPWTPL